MEEIFLQREDIDYTKLKMTEEGKYSVTRRKDAERVIEIMNQVIGDLKLKTITDATGCVGGDTIHFAESYKFVHTIEINKENFDVLHNNVELYNFSNIALHNGDATVLYNWKTDVLYVDPPWGGPQYKESKNLDLFMSEKRIDIWLEEILHRKNRPSFIFLKLPHNYNFSRLNFLSNVEYIRPYRIRGYLLISIVVHTPSV